jgi:nitroimidazol reductase NimA-like FMN-containing flavoprotein (pyridoxamine 5'-phosphate oxidase superfamily)
MGRAEMSETTAETTEPQASRPWMPGEYGVPASEEGMMTWEHVTELLRDALNYWIATTSADGRPHVRPVWAVWIDGILYFDGHPATGWGRNIARDPRISVQVEAGDEAVIVEGVVEEIAQADDRLAERLGEGFGGKYSPRYKYTPEPDAWRERGLWSMRPQRVFAWGVAGFPRSVTRWRFDDERKEG